MHHSPRSEALFPIGALEPGSSCPHKRRIRHGSILVCMICHKSGLDHLRSMRITDADRRRLAEYDPDDEWKIKETTPTVYVRPAKRTRRQKRAALFGTTHA